jgi:hypothetical protein
MTLAHTAMNNSTSDTITTHAPCDCGKTDDNSVCIRCCETDEEAKHLEENANLR